MLSLTSVEQVKKDANAYLGAAGTSNIDECQILRQYNCTFPSMVTEVEHLMTDQPVTVEVDLIDGSLYFLFKTQ